MRSFVHAWYAFIALGVVTFMLTAFVGRVPASLSAAVAMPHVMPYQIGMNIRESWKSLVDRRDHQAEIEALQRALADSEQDRRFLETEIERLEDLLLVRAGQTADAMTTASVTGGVSAGDFSRFLINKGTRDGIAVDMPVSVPSGLVGIVMEVAETRAVVRTAVDPQARIGVTVRGKGGQGIAAGELGNLIRVTRFYVDEPVEVGDVIETASYGGLFPSGIVIGVVEEVLPADPNDFRRSFIVRPAVNFATLREVVILAQR